MRRICAERAGVQSFMSEKQVENEDLDQSIDFIKVYVT